MTVAAVAAAMTAVAAAAAMTTEAAVTTAAEVVAAKSTWRGTASATARPRGGGVQLEYSAEGCKPRNGWLE